MWVSRLATCLLPPIYLHTPPHLPAYSPLFFCVGVFSCFLVFSDLFSVILISVRNFYSFFFCRKKRGRCAVRFDRMKRIWYNKKFMCQKKYCRFDSVTSSPDEVKISYKACRPARLAMEDASCRRVNTPFGQTSKSRLLLAGQSGGSAVLCVCVVCICYVYVLCVYTSINEQISNAFVRLHKPFRQKSTILMVDFCHLP